jgi:hypothetical protein
VQIDQADQPALREVRHAQAVVDRRAVAERPRGLASRVDAAPRAVPLDSQGDEVVSDRSSSSPVLEHDGPQTPTDVGVQRAQHELLAGRCDPEELMPSAKPHVDAGDTALQRASPLSRRQLTDPGHRVAPGAMRQQHHHGPRLRI